MKKVILLSLLIFCFSCHDDIEQNLSNNAVPEVKGDINSPNYFQWDQVDNIRVFHPNLGNYQDISLPWAPGSSANDGIPKEWLDINYRNPDFKSRAYSSENGWTLVYSNLDERVHKKYFALYNKYTGILRFFVYAISSSSGAGTSSSFWGITIDKSTSLFNFAGNYAYGLERKVEDPSSITSPSGVLTGSNYSGVGYVESQWYGFELECAYDNTLVNNLANFDIRGWAVNSMRIEGSAVTTGSINGYIQNVNSGGNFNLSLSNMFNQTQSSTNVNISSENISVYQGAVIDEKISQGDNFFKSLWSNVKNNASKWITTGLEEGAKKGIAAIISSGGSIVADALGGLASSVLGMNKPTMSKVELSVNTESRITLEGETILNGWGSVYLLPVPGTSNGNSDFMFYNQPLGVWNLKETPQVSCDIDSRETWVGSPRDPEAFMQYAEYNYVYHYSLTAQDIILNPSVANVLSVYSVESKLIYTDRYNPSFDFLNEYAFAFLDNNKYYYKSNYLRDKIDYVAYSDGYKNNFRKSGLQYLVLVNLKLKNKVTGEIYTYSKYFNVLGEKDGDVTVRRFYISSPDPDRPVT